MISKLVKKLEKRKGQLPNYGELMAKILIRKPDRAEFILKQLLAFLDKNKDVEVLNLDDLSKYLKPEAQKLRFLLNIRFKCSNCRNVVEERINLASWGPYRFGGKPVCEVCEEIDRDYAYEDKIDEARQIGLEEEANKLKRASNDYWSLSEDII